MAHTSSRTNGQTSTTMRPQHDPGPRVEVTREGVVEDHSARPALDRKERKIGRTMVIFALVAILLAVIGTGLVTRQWLLFGIALLVFIPFLFIIMAPLWLARTTQHAQREDNHAGKAKEADSDPM